MLNYMFSNGLEVNYKDNKIVNQNIKGSSTSNSLNFGTITSTFVEIVFDNTDGYFDNYSFKNGYINVYDDSSGQDVLKCKVYIDSAKEKNRLITIKAYDKIIKLDKTWIECKVPITLYDFIQDVCKQCDITMSAFNLPNAGYKIQNVEELKGKTCRECLSYALEICGTYAYLNSKEILTFKWFDFSKTKEIDISRLINYDTDYENSIVDNIYFVRGSKCYSTNNKPNGSIFITKDNPLLKECSSNKVYSIINNLQKRVGFEYLPCSINVADFFTYDVGDVVKFVDYKSNERYAIVGTINYSGFNNCTITSINVDEQDIVGNETSESVNNNDNTVSGELTFYKKINNPNMEYKECSDTTQIQYFLNANFNNDDSVQIVVNNIPYKTYNVKQGNNTIALMLKGDIIDDTITTIDVITNNTMEDIEVDSIFRNCLVIDYDEEDEPVSCGEYEITLPSNYYANEVKTFKFIAAIQGWMYKEEDMTIDGVQGIWKGLYFGGYNVDNDGVYIDEDFYYYPELHTTKQKDLFNDLKTSKHYIQVTFNGSYIDRNGNEVVFDNYVPDGSLGKICYKKSSEKDKLFATNTGIIEVQDGETITFCTIYKVAGEPNIQDVECINMTIQLIDDDINMCASGYASIQDMLDKDKTSKICVIKPKANIGNSQYKKYTWIGEWSDNEVNNCIINENSAYDFYLFKNNGLVNMPIYRNYSNSGFEKFEQKV